MYIYIYKCVCASLLKPTVDGYFCVLAFGNSTTMNTASRMAQMVKESVCNAGDLGLIPGSGRCPGEGNGNSLQCSCLENPMDGGAQLQNVRSQKSWTRLVRQGYDYDGKEEFYNISLTYTDLQCISVNFFIIFQKDSLLILFVVAL